MKDKERLLELLNAAFEREYNDVFLYLKEAELFRGKIVGGNKIGDIFESFSLMELRHADRIASKIVELGGKAQWKFMPFEIAESLRIVLEKHAVYEHKAISLFEEILALCGDSDSRLIIKGIKQEEKEHLDKITHILKHLKSGRK